MELIKTLKQIFTGDIFLWPITRIDFAVDLDYSLSELAKMIRVTYKATQGFWRTKSDECTGFYFGRGNHSVCVYDRKKKSEFNDDKRRIEVRFKAKKVPIP